MNIDCRPISLFAYKFELVSGTQRGELGIHQMSEQGYLSIDGTHLEIEKQGMLSGEWHLKRSGSVLYRALKSNPFNRRVEIIGPEGATLLSPTGLGRTMTLTGPGTHLTLSPNHPFTRSASIVGNGQDFTEAAFAFWFTALIWKRAAQASAG